MTDSEDVGHLLVIENVDEVLGEEGVHVGRALSGLVGSSISKHVGNDKTIALLLEELDLVVPLVGQAREPVQQEESRLARLSRGQVVVVLESSRGHSIFVVGKEGVKEGHCAKGRLCRKI